MASWPVSIFSVLTAGVCSPSRHLLPMVLITVHWHGEVRRRRRRGAVDQEHTIAGPLGVAERRGGPGWPDR